MTRTLHVTQLHPRSPTAAPTALTIEHVYTTHVQQVTRWVARLAGPQHEVEDLVQEVFLRVHDSLSSFRGESALATWIYAITANVVRARRRREWLRRFLTGGPSVAELEIAASGPTPLEVLERRRSTALVYAALETLSDDYRTIFILFELDGLSGEAIAELTGVRLPTVWVRLSRAREKLATAIERLEKRSKHHV